MAKERTHEGLTILEAVDNLSSMAELDAHGERLEEQEGSSSSALRWLDPHRAEENREKVKETFRVLNRYLHHMYAKEKVHLKDPETQKGIQAIMVLAGEAAQKVDKFTALFKDVLPQEGVTRLPEFQELQQFYLTKVIRRFQEVLDTEEEWQKEWAAMEPEILDSQRRGLKDLEAVRRDQDYELFYIRKEDGSPFFNRNLLRHIKLVGDFDESVQDSEGEDPFLKIKLIQDRESHASAKEILQAIAPYMDEFYIEALRYKEMPFVAELSKALMALMLSANPHNLMENTNGKSSLRYFADFHVFLRTALASEEYLKFVSTPPEASDRFSHILMNLSHALCYFFFSRIGSRKEVLGFIHKLIERGGKSASSSGAQSVWNSLTKDDESIRNVLKRYPNGPLLKTLDALREGEDKEGFDPLLQENFPCQMFNFTYGDSHVSCLRIPSPTKQEYIQEALIDEEFRGFLRSLSLKMAGQKHLLVNLQDRTSWRELARCIALEDLQKEAEFSRNFVVVTLSKSTDFYHQTATYQNLNQADLFIDQLKQQISSAEECGFHFPSHIKQSELNQFTDRAASFIHRHFFEGKEVLSRKNRLDFIEIYYYLLILQLVEWTHSDSLSLTCKDAVDKGEAMSAGFFSFLKMLSDGETWTKQDKDFLLWLFHAPALIIRERAVEPDDFNRTVSALTQIDQSLKENKKAILEDFSKLFGHPVFSDMKVQETE